MIITSPYPAHIEMKSSLISRNKNKQTNEKRKKQKNKQKESKTMTTTTQDWKQTPTNRPTCIISAILDPASTTDHWKIERDMFN